MRHANPMAHRRAPLAHQRRLDFDGGAWTVVDDPMPQPRAVRPRLAVVMPLAKSAPRAVQVPLFDWRRARKGRRWPKPVVQCAGDALTRTERAEVATTAATLREWEDERPTDRSQCREGIRPCPWASCSFHLAIDVNESGSLRRNFPGLSLEQMPATCALDIAESEDHPMRADGEAMTTDAVGELTNLVATNVQRIERVYLGKLAEVLTDDPEELASARKRVKSRLLRMVKR